MAGRAAARQYSRLRQARENRARERFGVLGVAAVRFVGDPQHVDAWRVGAEGERHVAARLAKHLAGKPVELLHDRRIPGSVANIDHLAIGPGGVTVIDAKNLKGKVRVVSRGGLFSAREQRLIVGRRDKTQLVDGVERQVDVVRNVLARLGEDRLDVVGALCFADVDGLPWRRLEVRGVLIDGARRVAQRAARSGPRSHDEVRLIRDELARLLPVA